MNVCVSLRSADGDEPDRTMKIMIQGRFRLSLEPQRAAESDLIRNNECFCQQRSTL